MPKKKPARRRGGDPRRAPRPTGPQSPLKVGGKALGALQVPFRTWLEAQDADETWMDPGDVEARLMESLGWLVLEGRDEVVEGSGNHVAAGELTDLLWRTVPAVAEANDLDAGELAEEVATAWRLYLTFLDESGTWPGTGDDLADCLDAVSDTPVAPQPNVVLALLAQLAARQSPEDERAGLLVVPAAARAAAEADGAPDDELRAARTAVAERIAERLDVLDGRPAVQSAVLSVLVSAATGQPQDGDGLAAALAGGDEPDAAGDARTLLEQLVADGVLTGSDPWTGSPALAAPLLSVVDAFVEVGGRS
ncbi:hypothetical protein [Kineococcus sp. SYSU DK004]|uniref:hypothetical protein n=1 Tax=Kineococcus sp. SYSU DK004 TaxID=3383125 RepID=UPI003D7E5CE0